MIDQPTDWNRIVSMMQTVVLLATVAAIFMSVGSARTQITTNSVSLRELSDVAQDLVKAQVTSSSNDVRHLDMLNELRRRVEALERNR